MASKKKGISQGFVTMENMKDVSALSAICNNKALSTPSDNLLKREANLVSRLSTVAKVDPNFKKLLVNYQVELDHHQHTLDGELAQRLFEYNQQAKHYLSRATSGTQDDRFISMVNSELVDECSEVNNLLQKHIFANSNK